MKLLGKIILLLVLLWAINQLVFRALKLPLLWGVFYEKQAYYEANTNNINTVFLGSSLTYRQVNNHLFDSLNRLAGKYTRSINYGVDGCQPAESYELFTHLMANRADSLQTIFVELTPPRIFSLHQLHVLRNKSFDGFKQFSYSLPLMLQSNYPLSERLEFISYNFVNVLEAEFNFGMLEKAYQFKKYQKNYLVPAQIEDFATSESHKPHETATSRATLVKSMAAQIDSNTQLVKDLFANKAAQDRLVVNQAYINHVSRMLALAESKKVKLIFVLPPRMKVTDYEDVLPVYNLLPAANKIELANPAIYPKYYSVECTYDNAHLSERCLDDYCQTLQQNYLRLLR